MRLFFLVLARDEKHVDDKIEELKSLGVHYLIVCGSRVNHSNVVYRKAIGKYDAINFGAKFVPRDVDVVVLNDVDTKNHNIEAALKYFDRKDIALVFARVSISEGPQTSFYGFLDSIRKRFPIAASGELMFIRRSVLKRILPITACKAEDSYILFKILESKLKFAFSQECYVETERTKSAEKEEIYKRKTVCGLYQALGRSRPPITIRVFYMLLPMFSPMLLVLGEKGYYWMKGILLGLIDYLRGDRSGTWHTTYIE